MRGSERVGVSLKPTIGVTDGGNVRSRAVMSRGDETSLNVSEPVNRLSDMTAAATEGGEDSISEIPVKST